MMTVSKSWLQNLIDNEKNPDALRAYQTVYSELIKPPTKTQKQPKIIDHDKIFSEIVRYYVEKKNYSVERANAIAEKTIKEQMVNLK